MRGGVGGEAPPLGVALFANPDFMQCHAERRTPSHVLHSELSRLNRGDPLSRQRLGSTQAESEREGELDAALVLL